MMARTRQHTLTDLKLERDDMKSNSRHVQFLFGAAVVGVVFCLVGSRPEAQTADPCASPANKIIAENCKPGNPSTEWDINGAGDPSIQGFPTDISWNIGETASFKIRTDSAKWRVDIYRTGWYQGNGAKFPFRLFDYQQQLLKAGLFDAYNQWLFGAAESLATYDNWSKNHSDQFDAFTAFQQNRIFKMPTGQYYQAN